MTGGRDRTVPPVNAERLPNRKLGLIGAGQSPNQHHLKQIGDTP